MSKLANVLATLLLLLLSSTAGAQTKLTIAIYAPNAPFESGQARYSFIQRLADQIKSVTGTPCDPKAFAKAADFEAAVKNKAVDFAVVDGIYMAQRGSPYTVLAVATGKGDTHVKWGLFAKDPGIGSVMDCQGKKLAIAATGPRDQQLVDNAFLSGVLPKHFAGKVNTPDVASAVTAVGVKSADCVFAPDSLGGKTLHRILDVGNVPNPAFVRVNPAIPEATVKKVSTAVVGHTAAGGAYDGWKAGTAANFSALGGRLSPKAKKPIMAEPEVVKLDDSDVLVPPTLEPTLPDVKEQFWKPSGIP